MQMSPEEQAQKEDWIRKKVEEAMTVPTAQKAAKGGSYRPKNAVMSFDEAAFDQAFEAERGL